LPDALTVSSNCDGARPCPSPAGEVLTRRQSSNHGSRRSAFDIVQPDVTKVGGISEERRIAVDGTGEWNGRFIPQGWNTAVGLAADLHLAPLFPALTSSNTSTGSPFIDEIVNPGGTTLTAMLPTRPTA
jgi:L-alanine-DL-glutamate epimerase-like enolase superfamily enzyme